MDLKAIMREHNHEQVVLCNDPDVGLFAVIAIHDTTLGPALGGCRMWHYENSDEAFIDALRLSRGMTYKSALAGVNLGGGKAVIIGDPKKDKSEALFRVFGQFVDSLGGKYITAEDVGTSVSDMEQVMMETAHVVGGPVFKGGSGDPSPFTALGVYHGIRACLFFARGDARLKGVSVAIQGVGHVGEYLVKDLTADGAKVFVSDVDPERVRAVLDRYEHVEAVGVDEIVSLDVDVFSPCALGAVINDTTIDRVKAKIIAGAANNQLEDDRHGVGLAQRGILYAPDFCINAGGLINVSQELVGYNKERATAMVNNIYNALLDIFKTAKAKRIPTSEAAELVAQERIRKIAHVRQRRGVFDKDRKSAC